MRSSKKRKLDGPTKQIMVVVRQEVREKLDRIAGPASLGATIETLIDREYDRRVKRMANTISSK